MDPIDFSTLLAKKLGSRQRHVTFLLGAGASKPSGLPDIAGLKAAILERESDLGETTLTTILKDRTVEEGLTWLRRVDAILRDGDSFDGMTRAELQAADRKLCTEIMQIFTGIEPTGTSFNSFALWVGASEYTRPVEIFTLNYDLLLEDALEDELVAYFDGFLGVYNAGFRADLVDAIGVSGTVAMPSYFTRVWKLHGSISWARDERGGIRRLGRVVAPDEIAAIHPSESKYDDSRRAPYVILHDRLRRSLLEPETILVVSGYSFGDQHVNEVIFDAIRARPRSEFVFPMYGEIPQSLEEVALQRKNVIATSPTAVISGGARQSWVAPAAEAPGLWTSTNGFELGDFSKLATFLSASVDNEKDAREVAP